MSLDPYKVLGVGKEADAAAIKSAYRKLARKYHPDVNPDDKAAEERFKEISEAYDILSDPAKKDEYDNLGREAFYERGQGGTGYKRPDFNSGGFSFDDIFGDLFGGGGRGSGGRGSGGFSFNYGAPRPQRGEDLHMRLSISLKEAAFGFEPSLEVGLPEPCRKCQGQGIVSSGGGVRPCPACRGQGRTVKNQTLKAKIPAGVDSGQKLRLRGKGVAGESGGPAGDLILEVEIRPDPVFTRKGRDLYAEAPISVYDALLGGAVEVPTLSGRAALRLPSGSQNGRKMRLKGQGLPANKKDPAGDLYVTIKVVLPTALTDEAKKAVARLAELAPVTQSSTESGPEGK